MILEKSHWVINANNCWNWIGSTTQSGYGRVRLDKTNWSRAHRAMWQQTHGEIPKNKMVLHTCNNRLCVNPAHLVLGDHTLNQQHRKERNISEALFAPNAKLSVGEAAAIRFGELSFHAAKELFGISKSSYYDIRKGATYKSLLARTETKIEEK